MGAASGATVHVRTVSTEALPNLIVIGAQKCGTNALHYYLSLHPEVSMAVKSRPQSLSSGNQQQKPTGAELRRRRAAGYPPQGPHELNFFIELDQQRPIEVKKPNWPRGVQWYRAHFDPESPIRGETSPNYTAHPCIAGVPERMHALVPDAKLIYLVRDPFERIAAHWVHNYAKRRERGTLAETLLHPNTSYIDRSCYAMQLERFLKHYPMERILVMRQSELRHRRLETLRRVFRFLGVDTDFSHPGFEQEFHQTAHKRRPTQLALRLKNMGHSRRGSPFPLNFWRVLADRRPLHRAIKRPDVRAALPDETLELLRADAGRLRELTGLDLSSWKLWDA